MRELTELLASSSAKSGAAEVKVLVVCGAGLTRLSNDLSLPSLVLLDASHNNISDIRGVFRQFPALWWLNVGQNRVDSLCFDTVPLALGLLDVSCDSPLQPDVLSKIRHINIMRLSLDRESGHRYDRVVEVIRQLPLIWVLDNDYIPFKLLKAATMASPEAEVELSDAGAWHGVARPQPRESYLVCACTDLPTHSSLADTARLDVLLEDYLDEVCYYNKYYCLANQLLRSKRKPWIDCHKLLLMSHPVRLDLSVVLTLSVTMDIPVPIFLDGLETRFGIYFSRDQLSDIINLPLFAKTAVVSIIRRICRTELEEYKRFNFILKKSTLVDSKRGAEPVDFESPPSFLRKGGFRHLASVRRYCDSFDSLQAVSSLGAAALKEIKSNEAPYSELELEIMKVLPDTPTRTSSTRDDEGKDSTRGTYSSWVSLAARHSVVLLSRSKKCPSLTKAQTSKSMQDSYTKLLPVLRAAKMSYEDMDIASTSTRVDGRSSITKRGSPTAQARVLSYGEGLPRGSMQNLSWNKMPPTSSYKFVNSDQGKHDSYDSNLSMTDDMSSIDDSRICSIVSKQSHNMNNNRSSRAPGGRRAGKADYRYRPLSPGNKSPSRESLSLSSRGINGYSADVTWESSFLLAPNQAIDAHNQTIRECDGWRPLHQPPVVVQSPVRFRELDETHMQRTAESDTDEISGFNPDEFEDLQLSIKSSGNYFSFSDDCPPHQLSAVIEGEVEGSSADDTHRIGVDSSCSIPLRGIDFAKKMEQELQRDLGVEQLAPGVQSPQVNRKTATSSPSRARLNNRKESAKENAMLSLMKEMGTFRNAREMALYNDAPSIAAARKNRKMIKQCEQPLKQLDSASYQPNSSVSTYGSSLEIMPCNHSAAPFKTADDTTFKSVPLSTSKSLDSVAWMKQGGLDGKRAINSAVGKRVEAFLTSLGEHAAEDGTTSSLRKNETMGSHLDDSSVEGSLHSMLTAGNNNVQGSEIIDEYHNSIMLPISGTSQSHPSSRNMATVTDILRAKYKYPHIYENNANIEWGAIAPGGKVLQPNWYPCPGKVVMRLKELKKSSQSSNTRDSEHNAGKVTTAEKAPLPASVFRPTGLPAEDDAARRFTATRALISDSANPKSSHVNRRVSNSGKGGGNHLEHHGTAPSASPTTMPHSRNYPDFEVTGATPRPVSGQRQGSRGGVIDNKITHPIVTISRRASECDSTSEASGVSRRDYSRVDSGTILYVDDQFPEDITQSEDMSSEVVELRNRFAEELLASLPPSEKTPSSEPRGVSPMDDELFGNVKRSTPEEMKEARSKSMTPLLQDDFGAEPVIPPSPVSKEKMRTLARNIKPGKLLMGLEPHFRGVEGHLSESTHGKPSISLSVLKPVTKSVVLNRSFKVTIKHK